MKKYYIFGFLGLIIVFSWFYFKPFSQAGQLDAIDESQAAIEPKDREVVVNIESNMTFSIVAEKAGLDHNTMQALLDASADVYDLSTIRVGRQVRFIFDKNTDLLKQLIYQIDSEDELIISQDETSTWLAERLAINYEVKLKTVSGTIESSLYESALAQGVDERAVIALADVFAWTIDFGWGIRVGDTYKFIYEERYRDGQYMMPGRVMAARFVNDGNIVDGYYFNEGPDDKGNDVDGYYGPGGESLQKIFLKNPVDFKYISSGFTTGRRYVEAFNVSTGHRAIDYAAAIGTPIRSIGDGVVTFAGWNSQGYGNLVSIRHNSVYSSNYAHQSKINVKRGQTVAQGQIIGKVGSTGFSTGPHLHFEIVKNGTKVNPLTLELPADKSVSPDKMADFQAVVSQWQPQLQ